MAEINLSDSRGRDAMVTAESVSSSFEVRYVDTGGVQVTSCKILRGTLDCDLNSMRESIGGAEELAEAFINGDPEVEVERFGRFLDETSRVYVNPKKEIVHRITLQEVVHNPDGSEKERRPKVLQEPNVSSETPLKWTGKMLKKSEACRSFVFSGKLQIVHVNGLTYDFLYSMAKELEEKDSLMLVAGGPRSNEPLLFRRGGLSYRGFLEGRTEGEKYALVLHLSNLEFKMPVPVIEGDGV